MKIKASRAGGFTLVEIMIVIAIIGLLAGIAVPNFIKARTVAQANTCINHLRQIDAAIQEWALETKKAEGQLVNYSDISSHLKGSVVCPADGLSFSDSYAITTVSNKPSCRRVTGGDHAHVLIQSGD
jgi:prepilin-type N-terminal cleavage/methylation domain-containing protein